MFIFPLKLMARDSDQELERRLVLYGLKDYSQQVKIKLENDIIDTYIPIIQSYYGVCDNLECLLDRQNYKVLVTASRGDICLPYTQCGFYECMEKKYKCMDVGVNYFKELALPTCKAYVSNIKAKKFTQKGYDWIYSVMVCLQKGLIDECELKDNCEQETPKKTCDYITDFTLKFHPGCYINSASGICKLPLKDKINIWRTVSPYLTTRERQEAFKVVRHCVTGGF